MELRINRVRISRVLPILKNQVKNAIWFLLTHSCTGRGHVYSLPEQSNRPGSYAMLTTPYINTGGMCLEAFYNPTGPYDANAMGYLEVHLILENLEVRKIATTKNEPHETNVYNQRSFVSFLTFFLNKALDFLTEWNKLGLEGNFPTCWAPPGGGITISPKQGCQWPHKIICMSTKNLTGSSVAHLRYSTFAKTERPLWKGKFGLSLASPFLPLHRDPVLSGEVEMRPNLPL